MLRLKVSLTHLQVSEKVFNSLDFSIICNFSKTENLLVMTSTFFATAFRGKSSLTQGADGAKLLGGSASTASTNFFGILVEIVLHGGTNVSGFLNISFLCCGTVCPFRSCMCLCATNPWGA